MRVIPVIDLMDGQVVRGIAGRRAEYRPIESQIASDARPGTVARELVSRFGFETVYVADLDAIVNGRFSIAAWQAIATERLKLWLDAGLGDSQAARRVTEALAEAQIDAELIVGLESLRSEAEYASIRETCDGRPPIFSLDLRAGQPLAANSKWRELAPLDLALLACSWGARQLIVLDLADVGVGGGTRTLDLCCQIRRAIPHLTLIAGGGVRGPSDLQALADAGCDAALVASAMHDGRLTREDVEIASAWR